MPYPVYLFDVDGTLTESATDICGAVDDVLCRNGYTRPSFEYVRTFIGRHLRDLFLEIDAQLSDETIDSLIAEYRTTYSAREHANTRVFDGVREALAGLGGRKSTATTKGTPTTRIVLERFGLLQYFDHVQGTDGFPAKPAPDVIERSLSVLNIRPDDVLFVGDSAADMAAGRAAGVKLCAVTYGYGNLDEMRKFNPDYWIDHPSQLLAI